MHRRTFMKAAATSAVATSLATALPSSTIGQTANEWRLLALWPKGHPLLKHLGRFAEMVRVVTQGGLRITIVPRGPVPPPKLLSAVGNGEAEMGHAVPFLWGKTIPSAAMLVYFPFGLTSREKEAWFAHGGGQELLDRIYGDAGCKFLPLGGTGPQMGGWFKKPLGSAADLKGLRIRIGGLGAAVMAAAGAKPKNISLSGGKIQAALKADELDAVEARTPAADLKDGYPNLAQVYHYPNWHEPALTFDLFINRTKWDTLPDHMRQALTLAAITVDRQMQKASVKVNAQALAKMISKHGTKVTPFPQDVMESLARHANDVVPTKVAKDPLSEELYVSVMSFRKATNQWTSVTDHSFLRARDLVTH
jgi:TRAP-type mannitol/chloroaromatic compound transport system substrate-binding protein